MSEKARILIAYDGSDAAEAALNDLPRAGFSRNAKALIVNVHERWLPPPSSYDMVEEVFGSSEPSAAKPARTKKEPEIQLIQAESALPDKARKRLASYFPDWKIDTLSLQGSPSFQIMRKANEWKANLIVVGSQGNAGTKLFSLGSVSQKIANEARCSVRVVRGNSWKKGAPTRILVGLDGTRAAQSAIEEIGRRMWLMGSEVRLVTAKDPSHDKRKASDESDKIDAWINAFIEEAKELLKQSDLNVSQIVEQGDPKQLICRAAEEWGADCIFIGSNDTGSSGEDLLLGSVATAIVARAHCTVEIVRHQN
ncbi:MAG: universal stress protein [Pyrinomonadaceae bacterium]